jgi:hydrogenase 3 maturation protease
MPGNFEILPDLAGKSILFVGLGNVLHHDDGVGVYMAQGIQENQQIRVIIAEVSLENYIGKINAILPDILILIDSVLFSRRPGYCQLVPAEKIMDYTTNTHNISMSRIIGFCSAQTYVLGVEPAVVSFGEGLSSRVKKKADLLVRRINTCFLANSHGFL